MSNLWNKVKQFSDAAPEAGFVNINFGKLVVKPMVVKWLDKDGVRTPDKRELKDGEELQDGEQLELDIKVLISELNPALAWDYHKNVTVKNSGTQKTDWNETVRPSFERVFGKTVWADALEKQPYVAVEDVPNLAGKSSDAGKVYGVPKVIARYASKEECIKARDARYPKKAEGETAVEVDSGNPPQSVIEQAKSLVASVGRDKALKMLSKKPFGDYDADTLFALAVVT